ncbi:MAG TPA: hypothetical protein VFR35_19715 [Actinoplanes sp.]|nr:hypothetical protein [Actinoplanes sp.]
MGHLLQARRVGTVPGLTDFNSGSHRQVATMFPACPRDWRWIGQRGCPGYDQSLPKSELVFRPHPNADGDVFAPVAEWHYVWGTARGWAMWRAIPPPGYLALGDVFHYNYRPGREDTFTTYACVRADCALTVPVGDELWNAHGTGTRQAASMWTIPDGTPAPWRRFHVQPDHHRPHGPFHILDPRLVEVLPDP